MSRSTILPIILSFICLCSIFLTACDSIQHLVHGQKDIVFDRSAVTDLAWNEDTVKDYRIIFYKDSSFTYAVKTPAGRHTQLLIFYDGHFRSVANTDTIYLFFKDRKPPPMSNYLIKGESGDYFVQYFRDGRPKMFLRREPLQPS
jgi:hypothetical protein